MTAQPTVQIVEEQAIILAPFRPVAAATSAVTDEQLLASWLATFDSPHSRSNFERTGRRLLAELPEGGLRRTTVEDLRDAVARITVGFAPSSRRQVLARCKSLFSYANRLGYAPVNVGAVLKAKKTPRSLAKRIASELEIKDVIRHGETDRNFLILGVLYGAGLRVSELVALDCSDVIRQSDGKVQLHVAHGKGDKERDVLLLPELGEQLAAFAADRAGPLFMSTKKGYQHERLGVRAVRYVVKRAVDEAGANPKISPHWFRHACASHALDRGANVAVVKDTLGHSSLATTSEYAHARPDTSASLHLDPAMFRRASRGQDGYARVREE
jgi:integrase/recombinase XerD